MNSVFRVLAFFSLVLTFSAAVAYAQTEGSTTTASVAAFVRDTEVEAGLVRRRVADVKSADVAKTPSASEISGYEHRLFDLINAKRVELGLKPVAWSDDVAKIARLHSDNMAKFNFFSHRGLDGLMVDGRADSLGVSKWTSMGENIAYNRGFSAPLETAVVKWLESPSHRENMLNARWKEAGIGIAVAADGTYYFTQVFILRK